MEAGWIIRVEKHNTYITSPHNTPKRIILKTPEQMHFNFRYNMESELFQGELFEDPTDNSMVRVSRLPFDETNRLELLITPKPDFAAKDGSVHIFSYL